MPSPLALAGQVAETQNKLIQNQTNQQQFRARNKLGQIISRPDVTDPSTGQTNYNKLNSLVAQDPDTSWDANEIASQNIARQTDQANLTAAQAKAYKDHFDISTGALANILNKRDEHGQPAPIGRDDVLKAGQDIIYNTSLPQELKSALISDVVSAASSMTDNSDQNRQTLQRYLLMTLEASKRMDTVAPEPVMNNLGNRVNATSFNRLTGQATDFGSAQVGLSPAELTSPTSYFDDQKKQPSIMTQGAFAALQGYQQPGGGFGVSGVAPQAPLPPAPTVHTAPALGQDQDVKNQTDRAQALIDSGNAAYQQRSVIKQALAEAAQPDIVSGPNAGSIKSVKQFLSQIPGVNIPSTADTEVLQKTLEQLAQQRLATLGQSGAATDAKLASAQASTPGIHMSNQGMVNALYSYKGASDATSLAAQAWQYARQHGKALGDYNDFLMRYNRDVDPFVLTVQAMPPKEQKKLLETLSSEERKKYSDSLTVINSLAKLTGWQP
ncbi:hypothetical protein ABENE_23055 [Asticcacaulis benevestitus DSM 16100 = ATCC BAA-896]|uniref:Uncharacterized protein n=2 Tax=Asticcacaulis TaxID=76890 RepID=V4N9S4_9CAUL|nr:hypothetical protein ABENE_23055 [Asticcacaulis benevestitus DSM 16100 = ATCC BAA-896]